MSLVKGWVNWGVAATWCLGVLTGCGSQGPGPEGPGGGGGGASSGGQASTAGSGSTAGAPIAGSAGSGALAGSAGTPQAGSGGGGAGPSVPRVENTEGESVLVTPDTALGGGACDGGAVYCNGTCLAAELQAEGNCTALKLGLGQTRSLALSAKALFYTAANREIIGLDLAKGTHASLVRGLNFAQALRVEGDTLYFSTEVPKPQGMGAELRRVSVDGGDVTVLSPRQTSEITHVFPLADRLLFRVGSLTEGELFTIPKAGGPATSFAGIDSAADPTLSGDVLYYTSDGKLCSANVDVPVPDHALNSMRGDGLFFVVEGDYLYEIAGGVYSRTPVVGGARQAVQVLDEPSKLLTRLVGRTPTQVVLSRADASDTKVVHLLTMPVAGGTASELVTIELGELHAVAGNASHIYLAVGAFNSGGLLRIAL